MRNFNLNNKNMAISITTKNKFTNEFTIYSFESIDDLKQNASIKQDNEEIIYFVEVNGTCVYSYLMFRCIANYTEGLNWAKLITIM